MASGRWQLTGCLMVGVLACGAALAGEPVRLAQAAAAPASSVRADDAGRVAPARRSTDEICRMRWREYRLSQDCFAPFLTVNGIKPDAFQQCGPALPDPSAECGPAPEARQ
jgi:hypothetical protein